MQCAQFSSWNIGNAWYKLLLWWWWCLWSLLPPSLLMLLFYSLTLRPPISFALSQKRLRSFPFICGQILAFLIPFYYSYCSHVWQGWKSWRYWVLVRVFSVLLSLFLLNRISSCPLPCPHPPFSLSSLVPWYLCVFTYSFFIKVSLTYSVSCRQTTILYITQCLPW